jgi:hypothetical protein
LAPVERGSGHDSGKRKSCVVIGDWNRAIREDSLRVKGIHDKVSYGSKLVRDGLLEGKIILLNSTQLAEGGPWTWETRADPSVMSCINLVVIQVNVLTYVASLNVNTKRV